jgi:PAS domain S-box-containing protein
MAVTTHIPPQQLLRLVVPAAAAAAIAGGILTLVGAAPGLGILDRLVTGSATVKLGTAVGFILLGMALWLLRSDSSGARHRQIASVCAGGVVIISVLMLGRYLLSCGLLQWAEGERFDALLPGLMPPALVASFFGLAAALLLLGTGRTLWLSQGLALSTAVLALVRYLYNFSLSVPQFHPHIGAYTVLIVFTLACGIFAARPNRDLMQLITSDTPGGVLVRRLLPLAIALPIALGWLRMKGQVLGFYNIEFSATVSVICLILVFSAALVWVGSVLLRSDVERRRLEEALIRGEAYFHALSDNTHDMVVIMSADGMMRYVSPSHLRVLGYRPEELIGSYPFAFMHPDDAPEALRVFEEGLPTLGNTRRVEYRFRHRDGSWRVIEAVGTNLLSHPVLAGVVITSRDVTESKDAAHRLQIYARQQAALAALSRDALMNKDLPVLMDEAVHTAAETLGVDYCELLELLPGGSSLRSQAAAGSNQRALADRVVEAGSASHAGFTVLSREPVVFEDLRTETRFTLSALLRAQGVTSGVSVAIGDGETPFGTVGAYTKERRTFGSSEIRFLQGLADVLAQTIERRHAERRLRLMLEQMPAILWTTDADLRFTRTVGAALASLGKRPDEIAGLTLQQFLETEDPQDATIVAHHRALAGAAVDYDYDWAGRRFRCHVEPLRDDSSTAIGVIGVLQDISERAQAEERLRTSEALFRAVVENGAEAISLWRADGTCIYLSPNHGRVFGYPSDKRLDGSWMDYVRPEDLRHCTAVFGEMLQRPGLPMTDEARVRRHDGSWIWTEVTACNLLDDPRVHAIVVNARDITERKRAEEALRKSEERFALAVAGANDGVWDWNFETDDQYLSPRCKEIIGFEEHELPDRIQALRSRIHPEDRERIRASFSAHLRGSTPHFGSEFRLQHKDGSYRYVVARGRVLRSPNGKPLRAAGSLTDIAARRRAEDALRESEQRFRAIADTAPAFIWMTGPDGACTYVNQRWLDFRGRALEQEIDNGWQDTIHPDDLASLDIARAAAREGREYTVELRTRGADGQYHWLLCTGRPRYTADGTFLGLVGSSVDITERKQAEEALHESEERYRLLVEVSPDPIWVHCEGQLVLANPAGLTLLGASGPEQVIGRSWLDFIHPDFHESVRRRRQQLHEGLSVPSITLKLLRLDGTLLDVEANATPFTYQGKPAILAVGRDITERKRSEEALRDYAERLEVLSRRVIEVQETERRNLAHELHDEIGQSLIAVKITLQRKQHQPESTALAPYLEDSIAVVDEAIRQVRDLSLDLRPSLLDDLGLVPALRWYVDRQAQRSGLNLQLIAKPLETSPPPEVETACFRVVQDALTNAMHHAHAQRVRIELQQKEAELHVVVQDDGIGFDVAQQRARATRGESMGLLSMEERAALLGGRLEIISAHARGTTVHACFPLKKDALQSSLSNGGTPD